MENYIYILLCEGNNYYTGSTKNLDRRMSEHFEGTGSNFTRKHKPIKLIYVETYQTIAEAFYREKQIQKWSRAKKEALIHQQDDSLKKLAKKKFTLR